MAQSSPSKGLAVHALFHRIYVSLLKKKEKREGEKRQRTEEKNEEETLSSQSPGVTRRKMRKFT